jgi:hypothetical protein
MAGRMAWVPCYTSLVHSRRRAAKSTGGVRGKVAVRVEGGVGLQRLSCLRVLTDASSMASCMGMRRRRGACVSLEGPHYQHSRAG